MVAPHVRRAKKPLGPLGFKYVGAHIVRKATTPLEFIWFWT